MPYKAVVLSSAELPSGRFYMTFCNLSRLRERAEVAKRHVKNVQKAVLRRRVGRWLGVKERALVSILFCSGHVFVDRQSRLLSLIRLCGRRLAGFHTRIQDIPFNAMLRFHGFRLQPICTAILQPDMCWNSFEAWPGTSVSLYIHSPPQRLP